MARVKAEQPLIPSVLDRLLDDEPEIKREAPRSRSLVLRELKQSVRRDLEDLLNTRRAALTWPPELEELDRSLVSYGIPDFTGARVSGTAAREEFRAAFERVILDHEPRFQSVHIHLLDNTEPMDRTLRFRIDALLRVDPAPEPVVFDSALEPSTGTFEVRGGTE
jgi:type VI secretion system protein ImpF